MTSQDRAAAGNGDRVQLTEAQEDYLKQIFLLGGESGRVSTQALARRLEVKPASVTEMVGRLAQLDLVEHAPYRGVRLTRAGKRVALEMLRHHRLLETYLVQALGYAHCEEMAYDENGLMVNAALGPYKIYRADEMPEMEVIGIEVPDPHGPYGVKGVGEIGLVPTAAAVANAFYQYDGTRYYRLPIKKRTKQK